MLSIMTAAYSQSNDLQNPPIEKTRIIKTDFFAPITGNLSFGYEQVLKNSITLDGEIGIIGVGFIDDNLHPAGIFLKMGPKLYFSPDYTFDGMHRFNDLQGAYFKPEIIYSGFAFDYDHLNQSGSAITNDRGTNHSFALMLNFGKQWILAKVVSLEMYAGIGYGGSIVNAPGAYGYGSYSLNENDMIPYKYSHLQTGSQVPLAFDAGLNIGILIR